MSSTRIELPSRTPDFEFNDRLAFGISDQREHFNLQLWDASGDQQGTIALDHAVGRPDNEKVVGSSLLHQSLINSELFAGMGMGPALKAVGIGVEVEVSQDPGYTYRVKAHYPSPAYFCDAANELHTQAGSTEMPLRFVTYSDEHIPEEAELSALADATVLIPSSRQSYEYILNRGVASLALPLQVVNQLKLQATNALATKDDRRYNARANQREHAIRKAIYGIHGILNTNSIVEFLSGQERAIRLWEVCGIDRGPAVEIHQDLIRRHLKALGQAALLETSKG